MDCLQSTFPLKIRLVLISAGAIANNDVMLQQGIGTRRGSHADFVCSSFAKKK